MKLYLTPQERQDTIDAFFKPITSLTNSQKLCYHIHLEAMIEVIDERLHEDGSRSARCSYDLFYREFDVEMKTIFKYGFVTHAEYGCLCRYGHAAFDFVMRRIELMQSIEDVKDIHPPVEAFDDDPVEARHYRVLPEYLDQFGPYTSEDDIFDEDEIKRLAFEWEKDVEDLLPMLEEV